MKYGKIIISKFVLRFIAGNFAMSHKFHKTFNEILLFLSANFTSKENQSKKTLSITP